MLAIGLTRRCTRSRWCLELMLFRFKNVVFSSIGLFSSKPFIEDFPLDSSGPELPSSHVEQIQPILVPVSLAWGQICAFFTLDCGFWQGLMLKIRTSRIDVESTLQERMKLQGVGEQEWARYHMSKLSSRQLGDLAGNSLLGWTFHVFVALTFHVLPFFWKSQKMRLVFHGIYTL